MSGINLVRQQFLDCRNPVLPPSYYVSDPEAHVMPDGRVYIYGSSDESSEYYCSKNYRVLSSDNMVDWADHGLSFSGEQAPWAGKNKVHPVVDWDFSNPTPTLFSILREYPVLNRLPEGLTRGLLKLAGKRVDIGKYANPANLLFAPDGIYKDGKYYLYFCLSDSSEGVAVSDRPEGPFRTLGQMPCAGIDPAVFQDDDGSCYYFWGQFRANGARLKVNMVGFEEDSLTERIVTEEEHGFHEGSSIRKRNGVYYFVYPCIYRNNKPTSLAYATSSHPLGPYQYRGIIVDNAACDPGSWNIHGSIEEVNGQWYVFYHRSSGNSRSLRRLCIEPITFNEDGTINEVKMTSQGAGRPFALEEIMEGWRACELSGQVYIQDTHLVNVHPGDTVCFRYVAWQTPVTDVEIGASGSGELTILCDGAPIGSVKIQSRMPADCRICGPSGTHEITLLCESADRFEIQWLRFHA